MGVPSKIRYLLKALLKDYSCRVAHDAFISADIGVHAGVRNSCLLSPLLFLIVLDDIMHKANVGKRQGIEWGLTNELDELDYADDLCLLSHRNA
ncbi:unnamed protein product [Euphydryas editha]|uniref:Reverse transcriptase domain-containing protein n=1 Tax=Euphydryas editha TaxID=104508 RepID=A0AAU9UYY7_EUPED|nr:unnamed protein product [Euphydryas editha]